MNNKQKFEHARHRVITYGGVMEILNAIAKNSGADGASYNQNLKDFDGRSVSGFEFTTHDQATQLGKLLSDLGIKYSHAYDSIKSQAGRLEIAPADRARADELFKNWSSWVIIEPRITGNAELDAKWHRVVSKSR
ncbi:MAG: hypothetical protein Q4C08_00480 [Pseudomonadota bacterium]|nr:hypothetical protein [Pseudomonadota bacterium]